MKEKSLREKKKLKKHNYELILLDYVSVTLVWENWLKTKRQNKERQKPELRKERVESIKNNNSLKRKRAPKMEMWKKNYKRRNNAKVETWREGEVGKVKEVSKGEKVKLEG